MTTPTPETPSLSELRRHRSARLRLIRTRVKNGAIGLQLKRHDVDLHYIEDLLSWYEEAITIAESLERENAELVEALGNLHAALSTPMGTGATEAMKVAYGVLAKHNKETR